jgi:hypothetical protein
MSVVKKLSKNEKFYNLIMGLNKTWNGMEWNGMEYGLFHLKF